MACMGMIGTHLALVSKRKKWNHSENLVADANVNIKKNIKDIQWEGVNWTDLARDRNSRQAVVKTVMTRPFA
jgi:hypothetical protein